MIKPLLIKVHDSCIWWPQVKTERWVYNIKYSGYKIPEVISFTVLRDDCSGYVEIPINECEILNAGTGLTEQNNIMANSKLFQYAILWHPTEKQIKDDGATSKVIVDLKTILAIDQNKAAMAAAMEIPADKKSELDQIEIVLRPF